MHKLEAIDILAKGKGDMVSVATMQAAAPWKDAGQAANFHVDASACMGSASSLGLGLALGEPSRKVIVLDGDGSLLMQLGSLVTIASLKPQNFYHFVFQNGHYESSGNQPIPGAGMVDFCGLATAAGYPKTFRFADAEIFRKALPDVVATDGPVLICLDIDRDDRPTRWPGVRMNTQVKALKAQMAGLAGNDQG